MMYIIKKFRTDSPAYKQALNLRYEVLRKPLNMEFPEQELKKDCQDVHFGLFEDEEIVACLTLTLEDNQRVKMRQVAVSHQHQRSGYGKILVTESEKFALESGYKTMYCHARDTAIPFYNKLGYEAVGNSFTEVGILHYKMQKSLA